MKPNFFHQVKLDAIFKGNIFLELDILCISYGSKNSAMTSINFCSGKSQFPQW